MLKPTNRRMLSMSLARAERDLSYREREMFLRIWAWSVFRYAPHYDRQYARYDALHGEGAHRRRIDRVNAAVKAIRAAAE